MKKNATLIAVGIPIITTIFAGAILASNYVSADDIVDEIDITVPVSCSMSGTGMTSHNANISNGTYQANIGTATLHAFCNDSEGFAIYATGYTGYEIGATNSNKLVGAATNTTIETGLATTTGNPDISNWAMKLAITQDSGDTTGTNAYTIDSAPNTSGGSDATFSQYHVVPNEYTKVAHKNSATDMTANTGGVKLTTTYAAYISKTQPADTYTGQVIYTLVHPASANAEGCNPSGTTISAILCMQDVSSSNKSTILSSMTEGTQYTLKDKRDSKTYTVSKLADGNIWMTQNLDLDLDSTKTYTNLDTDLGWNGTSYSTASWTPERSTYPTGTTTWGLYNSTTGEYGGDYYPESYDPGDLYWNGTLSNWNDWNAYYDSCYDNDTWCDETLNPISTYTTVSGIPTPQYHLGDFYNWSAAIATNDSSSYGVYDEGTDSYINTETNQSICPAGWTLPIGGYFDSNAPDKSFQNLLEQYGWDNNSYTLSNDRKIWESPIYLGLSGGWYGMLGNVGADVYSWSSVASYDENAYYLYAISDGVVSPNSYGYARSAGGVVRCVAR